MLQISYFQLPTASSTALQSEDEVEIETTPESPEIRRSSRPKKQTNYGGGGEESSDDEDITPSLKKARQTVKAWVAEEDDPADPEYQDHDDGEESSEPESPHGSPSGVSHSKILFNSFRTFVSNFDSAPNNQF